MGEVTMATDRAMRNVITRGDPLDQWQRDSIGKSAQLRLPLRDKVDLRRVALILRDLANRAEVISGLKHSDDFSALSEFKAAVVVAQGRAQSRGARRD